LIILSHRGYWKNAAEKNLPVAFHRSFDLGFGTETDVRDCAGKLLISHDPPSGKEMTLDDLLDIMGGRNLPLAMNIKADGLAVMLRDAMKRRGHTNWFVFDMSIPDMRQQLLAGNPVYARISEVEAEMDWHKDAKGIWLDAFNGQWHGVPVIQALRAKGRKVCIVSPELHKAPHMQYWQSLLPLAKDDGTLLCSDLPEEAQKMFGQTT
jgi:hypothetical protein